MAGQIVLFGATGYTGELAARALVTRGARPVLAGRSAERLEALAAALGGLETQVADVSRPASVRALVARGDVLVSTVGPFARWGGVAVEAALDAGAHYLDSTGEPAFLRRVLEDLGPKAAALGTTLVPACAFDWVPGNLAGALALEAAGPRATRLVVGYASRGGGGLSGGTARSVAGVLLEPSFAWRDGRLRTERVGARTAPVTLGDGAVQRGLSVGGSEHLALPAAYPSLQEVTVVIGGGGRAVRLAPAATAVAAGVAALPPGRRALAALLDRRAPAGGPRPEQRARGRSIVVAEARDAAGELLERVPLVGPDPYTFSGDILAWSAMTAAAGELRVTGGAGPVAAFGLEALEDGARTAGLVRRDAGGRG